MANIVIDAATAKLYTQDESDAVYLPITGTSFLLSMYKLIFQEESDMVSLPVSSIGQVTSSESWE